MNEAVQKALEKSWDKLQTQKQQQRDELALYFNLYTRDYAPDGKYSETYGFYDGKDNPRRYFRKIPQPLTDEEVAQLTEMRTQLEASAPKKQPAKVVKKPMDFTAIGPAFYLIGVLICIIAAIMGVATGNNNSILGSDMARQMGWSVFFVGVCIALLFLAIGKALMLLQDIANNTRTLDQ